MRVKQLVEWLAAYRHRSAIAAMATAGTPFLMPFSIGLVSLATLRGAPLNGIIVTGGAVLCMGLMQLLIPGALGVAVALALVYWLPAVALASVLLRYNSLALCLQLLALLGLAAVSVFWLAVANPAEWWLPWLEQNFAPLLIARGEGVNLSVLMPGLARFMTGTLVTVWLLTMIGGLLIGRWWQGLLGDEAQLGGEFRQHRQGYILGAIAAIVFVVAGFTGLAWLQNLVIVLVAMFMLQGLALVHWMVRYKGLQRGWLIAAYVVLPLGAPWSAVMLAGVGFLDNWMNLRRSRAANS